MLSWITGGISTYDNKITKMLSKFSNNTQLNVFSDSPD